MNKYYLSCLMLCSFASILVGSDTPPAQRAVSPQTPLVQGAVSAQAAQQLHDADNLLARLCDPNNTENQAVLLEKYNVAVRAISNNPELSANLNGQ